MYKKILLVAIALLVVGGIFYYQNRDVRVSFQDEGWKTYSNSEFGFSFEYPSTASEVEKIKLDYQPGMIFRVNPVDGAYFNVHTFTISEYEQWNKKTYDDLIALNADLSGYQVRTMKMDPDTQGPPTGNYLWQKTFIDGVPALDLMRCGGGDACSREVFVLKGNLVFEITQYSRDYFKKEPEVVNGFTYEVTVSPLRRIEETTDFDRVLTTFRFEE